MTKGRLSWLAMLLGSALVMAISPAPAIALSGCSMNSVSAVDEYCEQIPSAGGGDTALGTQGQPPLALSLSSKAVRRLLVARRSSRTAASALLSIPSRYRQRTVVGGAAITSGWSVLRTLVLIAGGLVAMLVAFAILRRRSPA
jgi:hypothetical protein